MSSWSLAGTGMRLPTDADLTAPPVTDEQRQAARITVCERADDREDARHLLAVLGLVDGPVDGAYRTSSPVETLTSDTTKVGPGGAATPTRGLADRMDTTD